MMRLPAGAQHCIRVLEDAGYQAYAVGGCVRDSLLGLTPQDYDLCSDALPEAVAALFSGCTLVRSGEKHGTIGVVLDGQVFEITTFRTEGGYTDSRHPDWVRFVPRVEEDLARRDFTVNAMAFNPRRGYVDPFGGQEDLKNGILRAVGDPRTRFREDPLRILRGVRFAARFRLAPEEDTFRAMLDLAPLMDKLARERVFDELCKLLPVATAADLCRAAPIITQVIGELAPSVGFAQHCRHHKYDVYTHTAYVVEAVPAELTLRWAALLHDTGKPEVFTLDDAGQGHFLGHAKASARLADAALLRLKAPTQLRQAVVTLIEQHMTLIPPDRKVVRKRLSKLGAQLLTQLLRLQEADTGAKGIVTDTPPFDHVRQILSSLLQEQPCLQVKDLAVDGHQLMALGLSGRQIGLCQRWLLEQVLEERVPNEAEALLKIALHFEA